MRVLLVTNLLVTSLLVTRTCSLLAVVSHNAPGKRKKGEDGSKNVGERIAMCFHVAADLSSKSLEPPHDRRTLGRSVKPLRMLSLLRENRCAAVRAAVRSNPYRIVPDAYSSTQAFLAREPRLLNHDTPDYVKNTEAALPSGPHFLHRPSPIAYRLSHRL